MSRSIKFRFFMGNYNNPKYEYWDNLIKIGGGELIGYYLLATNPLIIIEQYTGLKDKNGIEIYEGDIIKNKFNKPTLIYFEEGSYKAKIQNNENRSTIYNLGHLLEKWQFRVIGNIHENADLIM